MSSDSLYAPLLAEAEQLLKDITPGEWHAPGLGEVHSDHDAGIWARVLRVNPAIGRAEAEPDPVIADMCEEADAEFIAAAPRLVRDLIAALQTAERAQADLRAFVEQVAAREICEEASDHEDSYDSGPYCQKHGLGDDEDLIREARALLAHLLAHDTPKG